MDRSSDTAGRFGSFRLQRRSLTAVACVGMFWMIAALYGCGSSQPTAGGGVALAPNAGSAKTTTATLTPGSTGAATAAESRAGQSKVTQATRATTIIHGNQVRQPAKGTGGNSANDDNPGAKASRADSGTPAAGTLNPCTLVTQAQAQAFLGKRLTAAREAPLGPTCIYQAAGANAPAATDVVEAVSFSALRPDLKNVTQSKIAGRTAYCALYGQMTTFVPLPRNRLLSVTAPCAVGAKFAAAAVPKLGG